MTGGSQHSRQRVSEVSRRRQGCPAAAGTFELREIERVVVLESILVAASDDDIGCTGRDRKGSKGAYLFSLAD